jgi:hypothetical protein
MEASDRFGTTNLFLSDSRLALALLNHMRYQALNRAFGVSREQANVLTAVLLLTGVETAYEGARRIGGMRPHVSGLGAATAGFALRDAAFGVGGPSSRQVPAFATLLSVALLGGLAVPGLRRASRRMRAAEQTMRAAEQRIRRERIRRYTEARDRFRAAAASST